MTGSSNYFEAKQIDYLRGVAFPSSPAMLYVGVNSADNDAGGSEVTTTYFAGRVSYTSSSFTAPSTVGSFRRILNSVGVNFGTAIASATSVPFFSIWDAVTGGNCLFIGTFSAGGVATPLVFTSGQPVAIEVNGLLVELSITAHSIYLRDIELNWIKGTTAPAAPSTYMGLATAAAASGTVTEVTTTVRTAGRVQVTAWDAVATSSDYQFTVNTSDVDFGLSVGVVTALSHVPLWTDATAGNLLVFPALSITRNIAVNDPVKFNAGRYRIQQK